MRRHLRRLRSAVTGLLDRAGVIAPDQLRQLTGLAWPRIVTGFAIMSKQTVDLALVGHSVGAAAVAGLAFAYAYWQLAKFLGIGLAGGTVSLVSQNYGGDEVDRASLVVKQSVWVALAVVVPTVLAYVVFAEPLIGVLGDDPESIRHGATYLAIVAPALVFEFLNLIASRTYAGISDTFTPMVIRAGGGLLNVFISGVLVFGLGMGVVGVAIGTLVSTAAALAVISWGMVGREYGALRMRASPVPFRVSGPQFDRELATQLLTVSAPLMGRRVAEVLFVFPLLWIAASFGPVVVAAFEVGRRVRGLIASFNWGFSIASSTLVGQSLGTGAETDAESIGAAIIKLSLLVYVAVAVLVVALSTPIASLFVNEAAAVSESARFVIVAAVSAIALGIDGSATGVLRGAGDTRFPFFASLIGRYGFGLPVAAAGLVTPLGVTGLYLALVVEALVPGLLNVWRFQTDRWKAISRAYRPSSAD